MEGGKDRHSKDFNSKLSTGSNKRKSKEFSIKDLINKHRGGSKASSDNKSKESLGKTSSPDLDENDRDKDEYSFDKPSRPNESTVKMID
jgi:hypothetical protein